MKYEAVIFDLFGTVTDSYSYKEYQSVLGQMASILSVPVNDYMRLWSATAYKRSIGAINDINANIEYICRELGVPTTDAKVRFAAQIRFDFIAKTIRPRQDAIDVLSYLQSQGLKTGLISNCSPETPLIWKDTPFAPLFDVAVFSSSVGMKKPDPRIYQIAIDQLATEPGNCLYIGNGDNQELSGAAQVGMHPVLIRVPKKDSTDAQWEDSTDAEQWDGPVISSLSEVLDLVR